MFDSCRLTHVTFDIFPIGLDIQKVERAKSRKVDIFCSKVIASSLYMAGR